MIGKNWNFYVKKMQKYVMVLFGVFWSTTVLCGCTKKEEAQMMLLALEEEAKQEIVAEESDAENIEVSAVTSESVQELQQEPQIEEKSGLYYVHICGAVNLPGVYELPAGSRVYEAVELAGGFSDDAAKDYVNQAQVLQDAAKIVIPTLQEVEAIKEDNLTDAQYGILSQKSAESIELSDASVGSSDNELVNLNTASKAALCSLPGIGEAKADAIIAYRAGIGAFTSKEQIMEIDGIKSGLYSKIQDKICVK